ncbi:MAG: hypothetical protein K2I72_00940 [Bacilli bacterium]|nr:hypothetical protein [Bacilli bacterium]
MALVTELEYREAYLLWKEDNSEKTEVPLGECVILSSGKKVSLGNRINFMRSVYQAMLDGRHYKNYKDLTEEQIAWWTSHGVNLDIRLKEEDYRQAYLIWKEKNPEKEEVPSEEVITLPNGKIANLGRKIIIMRAIYQAMQEGKHYKKYKDLTEEQISWWSSHGVNLGKGKMIEEEEYREAYLLFKKEKNCFDVPKDVVVILPNGRKVNLGSKVLRMRNIYSAMKSGKHFGNNKDLTKEQITWWTKEGLSLDFLRDPFPTEEEYREAFLKWKTLNPGKRKVSSREIITLDSGKIINLGEKITRMIGIYHAMLEGREYGHNKDLTEEQIEWWTKEGLDWNQFDQEIGKYISESYKINKYLKILKNKSKLGSHTL